MTPAATEDHRDSRSFGRFGPVGWLALVLTVGALAGYSITWGAWWLIAAVPFFLLAITAFFVGRSRLAAAASLLAAMLAMACWSDLNRHWTGDDHLNRVLAGATDSRLVRVTGRVSSVVKRSPPPQEGLARYQGWQPTSGHFLLDVQELQLGGPRQRADGRLIVRIRQGEPVPEGWLPGAQVELTGWLSPIEKPKNPGETDWSDILRRRGIDGRLYLESWDTGQILAYPGMVDRLMHRRDRLSDLLAWSLDLGQRKSDGVSASRRAFLQAILLGRYQKELRPLQEDFRQTGLVHILTISGAHLAMFTAMVWMIVRAIPIHPRKAALLTLTILLGYVWVLPPQVPVIRSAIMAGLLLVGYASGRRVRAIDLLALALVLVLIVDPVQVVDPGAQLSFAITAGLLLFTKPLAERWMEPPIQEAIAADSRRSGRRFKRFAWEVLAANTIGFVIGLPLVAFHFGMVNALAVLLSILAMPLAWAILALGYLKIVLGLIWPSVGLLLAWPTNLAADGLIGLVSMASRWPGSGIELESSAGLVWTLVTLATGVFWLAGALARWPPFRSSVLWLSILLMLGGWLYVDTQRRSVDVWPSDKSGPGAALQARLTMFSVGDGSCYLLQWRDAGSSSMRTWMFDCGSGWLDGLVEQQIAPALKSIGADRIDTLVLSHVDLDHIGGSIDLARRIPVGRLLVNSAFLAHAQSHAHGPAAMVVEQFSDPSWPDRPRIETADQDWQEQIGGLTIRMLHPPKTWGSEAKKNSTNDQSMVMSVQSDRWRLILNGDIQQQAISSLLTQKADLKADVIDLPHHGSFVRSSLDWLSACDPKIVLQSSGPARLRSDPWANHLQSRVRLVTHRHGMVQVDFMLDGAIVHRTFLPCDEGEPGRFSIITNNQERGDEIDE